MIFNKSLNSGTFPKAWKDSYITPIPKVSQPMCEEDTRPISLTSCLAKVLEDFVVRWIMFDVENLIDTQQSGCLRGSSTAYCLLDMIHNWLSHLDSLDRHIRLLFLDCSKAFDRIGYNVLINKLINMGLGLFNPLGYYNFLSNRIDNALNLVTPLPPGYHLQQACHRVPNWDLSYF